MYSHLRVTLTPLIYDGVYGNETDVTSDIDITARVQDNINQIKHEIDNGDFDFGVFTLGGFTLKCFNDEGKFSPPTDPRSLFTYSRDLAIVKLKYADEEGNTNLIFEGLINEDTAKDEDLPESDLKASTVSFKVLSLDSILRHVEVSGGTVESGVLFSDAIKQILNTSIITNVLNYDPLRISLSVDLAIDDGEHFTGMTAKEALDDLLLASHSILVIDKDRNITVKAREQNDTIHHLYAPHDPLGRGNILKITDYNSGLHRTFSSIKVNETEATDAATITELGYRQKSISLDFIDNGDKEEQIANTLLDEFKIQRPECVVHAPFAAAPEITLLDQVRVDYPLRLVPPNGQEHIMTLPFTFGIDRLNRERGAFAIPSTLVWKVIALTWNFKNEVIKIKIRQIGTSYGEETIEQ